MARAGSTEIFHDGERLLQSSVGVQERMAGVGHKAIRNHMPEQHRQFFTQLPFIVVGAMDQGGQPWASLLCNPPGFIHSPDPYQLTISALPMATDPLRQALVTGASIALLGIEQHTRRRNRMNGLVSHANPTGFEVSVQQSFGNCPKYIQTRQASYRPRTTPPVSHDSPVLHPEMRRIIENADTLFIASAHPHAQQNSSPSHGVDISHRGGKPGFVRIETPNTLSIPDYSGNHFFNTLGNLMLNPRAGLLFIDFATGDLLYLAAEGEIISTGEISEPFAGAERIVRFRVHQARYVTAAAPLHWQGDLHYSPFLE